MFELFETFIAAHANLTKDELMYIRSRCVEKKLRRKQLLLKEGEVCRYKFFVASGLLRTYRIKDDGTEHIMWFASENSWATAPESFKHQTPSRYSIEALEDTHVILWMREDLDEIMDTIPAFKSYVENLLGNSLDASYNRILMNISYTAEEKYQAFIATFPDVFRRVPLHMVASYLGVSRETLSRVRHALLKQEKSNGTG